MKRGRKSTIRILIIVALVSAIGYAIYEGIIKERYPNVVEGDKAPYFALKSIDNEKVEINNITKDGVIINFWATWCDYCQREMPAFENIYKQYKDKNIEIISINLQEPETDVKKYIKEKELSFPVVIDTEGEVSKKYQVTTVPTTYLLDSKGKVIKKNVGEMDEKMLEGWMKQITH
ncbi:thiol-disulfide oxidoreductase ResA [Bacillus sp. R86525]|uniref:thiol-disulfide oxidoreductase ResA n=1 Tax=Bacillus sp. R86525 TaxID=3101709 RepID=UPI00366BB44D